MLVDTIERAGTLGGAEFNKREGESDTRTKYLHITFPEVGGWASIAILC